MRIAVLGAAGALGQHVVRAALRRGHSVRALVRPGTVVAFPQEVEVVHADHLDGNEVLRSLLGVKSAFFCAAPPLARWEKAFHPLLDVAMGACNLASSRLVFPARSWVFGTHRDDRAVAEGASRSPETVRGDYSVWLEQQVSAVASRWTIVRLPQFFGPRVRGFIGDFFEDAVAGRPLAWPGDLGGKLEMGFVEDCALALVEAGTSNDLGNQAIHVSGAVVGAGDFLTRITMRAGRGSAVSQASTWKLRSAALLNADARARFEEIAVLTSPARLDARRYLAIFGRLPLTSMDAAIARTVQWYASPPAQRV